MTLKPAALQWSEDGGLQSQTYGDVYFQRGAGFEETRHVFLHCNNLTERFSDPMLENFQIAELGFGSGLNFLLTAALWQERAPKHAWLDYVSIEKHPLEPADLRRLYALWPEFGAVCALLQAQYPPLIGGFHTLAFPQQRIRLTLAFGDAREMLPEVSGKFDVWYLDGFSPAKNPGMWGEEIYSSIAARTKAEGTLSTFTAAGAVRRGLAAAGFTVKKIKGYGIKWAMTVARYSADPAQKIISADPAQNKTSADQAQGKSIIVLGAGIAGCAAAYALARRGYAVTLIDRQEDAGMETSGNPCGVIYPTLMLGPSPAASFHQSAFSLTRSLVAALGLASWNPCGVLHLDLTAEEEQRTQKLLEKNGFPPEYATIKKDMFSGKGGLWQPLAGHLAPPEFCRALAAQPGVNKIYATQISGLEKREGRWRATDMTGALVAEAEIAVIALNNSSRSFAQTAWLPQNALRGQITMLKATAESRKLDHVICHGGYIAPAQGGQHVIGATFQKEEPGEFGLREADQRENLENLRLALPAFGFTEAEVAGGRAGYRSTTPDKLPLIGPCPDYAVSLVANAPFRAGRGEYKTQNLEGLYVTTGFGAHGMAGAPLAGEILAALIAQAPLPVPESLLPYLLPERYIRRGLRRGEL